MQTLMAGGCYFLLIFASGFAFGTVRVFILEPNFGKFVAVLMEAPLLIYAMVYFCKKVCMWFSVPAILRQRAQIGAFAFALLICAELIAALMTKSMLPLEYLRSMVTPEGGVAFLLFVLFGAVPMVQIYKKR